MTKIMIMARAYAHKTSKMKLVGMLADDNKTDYDEVYIDKVVNHPDLGLCFVGVPVFGIAIVDCHFPIGYVRLLTLAEQEYLLKREVRMGAKSYRHKVEDFATKEQLDKLLEPHR